MSDNGPFLLHLVNSEDPANKDETYIDLFIVIGTLVIEEPYLQHCCRAIQSKSEPIDLSNYILRRTSNGSHWMKQTVRLEGIYSELHLRNFQRSI